MEKDGRKRKELAWGDEQEKKRRRGKEREQERNSIPMKCRSLDRQNINSHQAASGEISIPVKWLR